EELEPPEAGIILKTGQFYIMDCLMFLVFMCLGKTMQSLYNQNAFNMYLLSKISDLQGNNDIVKKTEG
ncbi:hypothetical protein STEG23_032477, partial [Scotinomys teguina]